MSHNLEAVKDHSRDVGWESGLESVWSRAGGVASRHSPVAASSSSGLVIAQVAFSLVLMAAARLFIRTFDQLASAPLGFDPNRVLVIDVDTARARWDPASRRLADYVDAALARERLVAMLSGFFGARPPAVRATWTRWWRSELNSDSMRRVAGLGPPVRSTGKHFTGKEREP